MQEGVPLVVFSEPCQNKSNEKTHVHIHHKPYKVSHLNKSHHDSAHSFRVILSPSPFMTMCCQTPWFRRQRKFFSAKNLPQIWQRLYNQTLSASHKSKTWDDIINLVYYLPVFQELRTSQIRDWISSLKFCRWNGLNPSGSDCWLHHMFDLGFI